MSEIKTRKDEHLDIVLSGAARPGRSGSPFDAWSFEHVATPDLAAAEIDLSVSFLGRKLGAPLLISSMTGGPARAAAINAALAEAAQAARVAMAVGSQRIAIETQADDGITRDLRRIARDVPLLANIGAAQVAAWRDSAKVLRAVDMIEADALFVHFNPLQEAIQPGGDTDWRGLMAALADLAKASPVPLFAKEVGSGISGTVARRLIDIGFSGIDVAGAGGTSWAAVEAERTSDDTARRIAAPFRDWGIATPDAVVDVAKVCPEATLIASGGIRHGVDAAIALRLGADLVGQAAGLLEAALRGADAVKTELDVTAGQLRVACFCTGSQSIDDLKRAALISRSGNGGRE